MVMEMRREGGRGGRDSGDERGWEGESERRRRGRRRVREEGEGGGGERNIIAMVFTYN